MAQKIPTAIAELSAKIRCGQCSGLERDNLVNNAPCKEQGVLATSRTCNSFRPDSFDIAEEIQDNGALLALARIMSKLPTSKLDLLAAIIQNDKRTRRAKTCFGQRVYVRYRGLAGANYMSNFMQAFILDADKNHIRVMSRDGKCTATYQNDGKGMTGPVIYTKSAFDELRATMIENEMLVDPDEARNTIKRLRAIEEYNMSMTSDSEDGQITTIDTVFEENDLPRGRSSINDLSTIVRDIEGGFDLRKTKSADTYRKRTPRRRKTKDSTYNVS